MTARKQIEELTEEIGRTPTKQEIADAGINVSNHVDCISLNKMIADNEELDALVGDDNTETTDYVMECELMLEKLKQEVSPRDFNIFVYRYGLLGVAEHTLNEISDYHDITRSRIHQIT